MRVISSIEQPKIIEKILKHLDLWETRNHDPPARKATHIPELVIDLSYSQLLKQITGFNRFHRIMRFEVIQG